MSEEFITIAKVVKTQGRVGEVATELFTDFPERFEQRRKLYAWLPNGERRELELEDFWSHKGQMILKFAGIDSMNDAELLLKSEIQIPASERAKLEDGSLYVSDLLGCKVFEVSSTEREVGIVKDVDFSAGVAPLLVVKGAGKEVLIPLVESFLAKTDLDAKRIEMKLPEGLLELDNVREGE